MRVENHHANRSLGSTVPRLFPGSERHNHGRHREVQFRRPAAWNRAIRRRKNRSHDREWDDAYSKLSVRQHRRVATRSIQSKTYWFAVTASERRRERAAHLHAPFLERDPGRRELFARD